MRYFIVYKPFGMLSQFTKEGEHTTLANLNFKFPSTAYPVGRLDSDSEGLILLTDDKKLNNLLLNPSQKHRRTYLVQVEGEPDKEALQRLEKGVALTIDKKPYTTLPAKVEKVSPPSIPEREPPIRVRKNIPTSWLKITLIEGKNRQVRKMTAQVGYPTLRLIRLSIEDIELNNMQPGDVLELSHAAVYKKLHIGSI